jgi:hypothetical protein
MSTNSGRQSLLDAGSVIVTTGAVVVAGAAAVTVVAAIVRQALQIVTEEVHCALIRPAFTVTGLLSDRIGLSERAEYLGKMDTVEASVHWQLAVAAPSNASRLVQVNTLPAPPMLVGESKESTTALPSELKTALRMVGRAGSDAAPCTERTRDVV